MLQSTRSQTVRYDLGTEQQQQTLKETVWSCELASFFKHRTSLVTQW